METESLQYTIINHVARKKLGLTLLEYSIIDSIYNLSNNPRNNGYSTASKQYIADWLGCSKRSVINTIAKAINQGLVEKPAELRSAQDSRLRTTQKWYDNVIMNNTGEIISQTKKIHHKTAKLVKKFHLIRTIYIKILIMTYI